MSLMTGRTAIRVRLILRRLGVAGLGMRMLRTIGYERLFTKAMEAAIRPGYCVWDVGANVGAYSQTFSQWVLPEGKVFAFEPLPETLPRLRSNVADASNVRVLPLALSDRATTALIERGDDEQAATARITENPIGVDRVEIELEQGDRLIEQGKADIPDVIKIDVEGHELEVLKGMQSSLLDRKIKHIFIEVHFAIFYNTSRDEHPSKIEDLLDVSGFHLRWVDQSHLHAFRAG